MRCSSDTYCVSVSVCVCLLCVFRRVPCVGFLRAAVDTHTHTHIDPGVPVLMLMFMLLCCSGVGGVVQAGISHAGVDTQSQPHSHHIHASNMEYVQHTYTSYDMSCHVLPCDVL